MPATAACAGITAAGASVLATTAASAAPATRAFRRRRGRSAGAGLVDEAGVVLATGRRERSPLDLMTGARRNAADRGICTELPHCRMAGREEVVTARVAVDLERRSG